MIVLAHETTWEGDVDTIAARDVVLHPGLLDISFGQNSVRFKDGSFHISAALQEQSLALRLQMKALSLPLLMRSNRKVGEGRINWLVVPRLQANGTITVGNRVHRLAGAPAYHDHNWGRWLWGHDLAWEWGFALPPTAETPWSVVVDRTTNRSRTHVLEMTLALWKGPSLARVFTQNEVQLLYRDYLNPRRLFKFPRVMALLAPEMAPDIPAQLEIHAQAGGDWLQGIFHPRSVAQLIIPNETDLGVTIINEVEGSFTLHGSVRGDSVQMEGGAVFEFLT